MTLNVALPTEKPLSARQEAFIAALLKPMTVDAAAKVAGVSDRTAHRWLRLPHVQLALETARHEAFDSALEELRAGVAVAITTLLKVMTSDDSRAYVRVQAAAIWLQTALQVHKMSDLEAKVSELETLLKGRVV